MKEYTKPILEEEKVEIEDIVAASTGVEVGEVEALFPWLKH